MMHEMPDEWQSKMAELLDQWDATWDSSEMPDPSVMARKDGKLTKWPDWLLNYRHPCKRSIDRLRASAGDDLLLDDDELPGMWSCADLIGGETDITDSKPVEGE